MTVKPTGRRWGRVALALSLILNVLLIGLIVGAVGSGRAGPQRGFEAGLGPLGQVLPREDRIKIGRQIRRALRDSDQTPQRVAATMREVLNLLEAESFNAAAFAATVRAQQTRQETLRSTALERYVAHLETLSLEERRAMAAALRDQMSRRGGKEN